MSHIFILLVHPSAEMMVEIKQVLETALKEDKFTISLDWEEDTKGAMRRIERERYDLIMARGDIPFDKKENIGTAGQLGGISLLKWLRKEKKNPTSFIVISTSTRSEYDEAKFFENVSLIVEGEKALKEIVDKVKAVCKAQEERELPKRVEIDLTLSRNTNNCRWAMKGINLPFPLEENGPLSIKKEDIKQLLTGSERIAYLLEKRRLTEWREGLLDLGIDLTHKIIEINLELACKLWNAICQVGHENVWIRFIVEEEVHPIVLEALLRFFPAPMHPHASGDHWMLWAPIYRRIDIHAAKRTYALFQDREDMSSIINCLIIQANIPEKTCLPGFGDISPLNNAEREAASLKEYLENNRDAFSIGEVKIIDKGTQGRSFKSEVKDVLMNRAKNPNWHIIHYAGHTQFDEKTKQGVFVLPGRPLETVDASEYAMWLRECKVSFVYLSSCHSSAEGFLFQLAKEAIPAVVGFRWDLPDEAAADFADRFYKHLFAKRSLEYGFLEAKKEIYYEEKYRDQAIWASPVLVMQVRR